MAVKEYYSASSRGELAPEPNTFVQPGTYGDNPDTAMTDGVKHAMLKAQYEIHSRLVQPHHVRRHLERHHRIRNSDSPLADHARLHNIQQLSQGHSISPDGDVFHGTTDIGAGTANFAAEAPPTVELIRHVRTPEGSAFYHKSIGTPLIGDPEQTYLNQKAKNAAAEQVRDSVKAEKSVTSHKDLLAARTAARAKYPAGHPERLAAERAVRASRKTSDYREGRGGQAHVSDAKKSADAKKDPGFFSPKESVIATGSKPDKKLGVGGTTSPREPEKRTPVPSSEQVSHRLAEISRLSTGERSRYYSMRNAGVMHGTAMSNIAKTRGQQLIGRIRLRDGREFTKTWTGKRPTNWKSELQALVPSGAELVGATFTFGLKRG